MKAITIVGGGLAGLALGIGLRQKGVPVRVFEAGRYPRHRVCGEFISGTGQQAFEALGLEETLKSAGPQLASTAALYAPSGHSPLKHLSRPAYCVSRFDLDASMAREFSRLGGLLVENQRWRAAWEPGVVRATGRRMQPEEHGWRWFGVKAHARKVHLSAALEMHFGRNDYVGLCQLSQGRVNVCGLFRRPARRKSEGPVKLEELLRGQPETPLHARLAGAEFEAGSFCSVAGLGLARNNAIENSELRIGDAVTMIPPVTGNGMSMALEGAQLALGPIVAYAQGQLSWNETGAQIHRELLTRFQRRLFWAAWLQKAVFSPLVQSGLAAALLRSQLAWNWFFSRTR